MTNIIQFPHRAPRIARERLPFAEVVEVDLAVADHGSVWLLHAVSDVGVAWADENLDPDRLRWAVNGCVVEHRYLPAILDAARRDGLTITLPER